MDAIDARDWRGLAEELGDLLLQSVFFAQMASEAGHFHIGYSIDAINDKLIRRHPHVFADAVAETAGDVKKRWDEIKSEEKQAAGGRPQTLLDDISRSQPALVEAQHISRKAAGVGFEWESVDHVIDKLHEELDELSGARKSAAHEELGNEIGDLLFVIVNIARWLNVDAEQALRKTNAKFRKRFAYVERGLAGRGRTLTDSTIEEMEALWQEAKLHD
jgi:MazG family protein